MLDFLSRLFRPQGIVKPAFQPTQAELLAALQGGETSPEMKDWLEKDRAAAAARRQTAEAEHQQALSARETALRALQKPGELWLHTLQGPALAVARYPGLLQLAENDNKLVNGHAGSGRSVLLARMAKTDHAAGKVVVIINSTGNNPHNPGPLWLLTHALGGEFLTLGESEPQRFNPFHMPGEEGQGWSLRPSMEQVDALAEVLVGVLRLTRYASAMPLQWPAQRLKAWLYDALAEYYSFQEEEASNYPSFEAFAAFVGGRPGQNGVNAGFLDWFGQVSPPFLAGGELSTLLSADFSYMGRFTTPSRILHVNIGVGDEAATGADTPGFTTHPYPFPAAEALTRGLLLTLHTLDSFLGGQRERPLTVVLDELRYECLGAITADYLDGYLRHGSHYQRVMVAAWHECPAAVFHDENPAALVILGHCGTQLLLTSGNDHRREERYEPLDLSEEEIAAFAQATFGRRTVLIRRPQENFALFDTELSRADVAKFIGPMPAE